MMATYTPKYADTLGGTACDDLTSTQAAERNLTIYKEKWQVEMGWDDNSPFPEMPFNPDILDHLYTLRNENGRVIYGTEPYGVTEEGICELGRLTESWHVWIGQLPLWFPGRTTQILFERKAATLRV